MRIDPSLINLRPYPANPHARWLCYGDAGVLVILCDDWGDPALVTRSMQRMEAIVQSLVDQMSAHRKIAFLAAAEDGSLD